MNEMMMFVKNRRYMPEPVIDLKKYMIAAKMESYFKLCGDRIAQADLIDGAHISLDYDNPQNLFLDRTGLEMSKDIISGYVDQDTSEMMEQYLFTLSEQIRCQNNALRVLRTMDKKALHNMCQNPEFEHKLRNTFGEEIQEDSVNYKSTMKLIKMELQSRKPWNLLRLRIMSQLRKVCILIRYRNLIRIFRRLQQDSV